MDRTQNKPFTITRGRESPPLKPDIKRFHYQFSALLPQTQLTFASVLQGLALGVLLLKIPLPPDNISWASGFHFVLVNQYLYLPYIISSLIIIFIWIQTVHASLFIIWPLSIFQATLLFILTISEVLAFQKINSPSISPWLFGIGWIGIVGGFIRIHNLRWYNQARKASHEPVQASGFIRIHNLRWYNLKSIFQEHLSRFQQYLKSIFQELFVAEQKIWKQERTHGLLYTGAGFITVMISIIYGPIVPILPFLSWIILVLMLATLFVCILLYRWFRQSLLNVITKHSDLIVLKHGSIIYNEKISSEESSKGIVGTTVEQITLSAGQHSTLRICVIEEPLTPYNLSTIISALTELSTKFWLIASGRLAELIEYSQTHDVRFVEEAGLVITRITYDSPLDITLGSPNFDPKNIADAVVTTIDGITQRKARLEMAELEIQAKAQAIKLAEQTTEQGQQMAALEREKQAIEIEKQPLSLLQQQLDLQKQGIEYAFEIAKKVVDLLHPNSDDATKSVIIQALLPNILQLQNGKGIVLA